MHAVVEDLEEIVDGEAKPNHSSSEEKMSK
jgi:hypothetical protein